MKIEVHPILQSIVEERNFDDLPTPWSLIETVKFSKNKNLWDFQQEALKNAIKTLYLFFKEDNGDKEKFYMRYDIDEKTKEALNIRLDKTKKEIAKFIQRYYQIEESILDFKHLINRAAFYMATGSGKTLVIVKIIEALKRLMDSKEIPKRDILVLTYRDDLIKQLKDHVHEFNELANERGFRINLRSLQEYDKVKNESLIPYTDQMTIFYYRSDLISDKEGEKIINFENYENNGEWYILLDEAHKGDKEESKRQMFYSIMSRNGFLFNFSATFTEARDIITTAYNFNLKKFIESGYGKHIYLFNQELKGFKDKEDYNDEEKRKIVLESLILLTYLKKVSREIRKYKKGIYHEP